MLERRDGKVPGHRRKIVEKLLQGVATLDVVHKRLNGNAGPHKNRRAPKDLRVRMNR